MHLLAARLPGTQTRAIALLALFAAVQVADGVMTFSAVERYGSAIEGNPLLAFAMGAYGAAPALVGAKMLAIALAVVLHVRTRHAAVAVLTAAYVFAALAPWAWILS